MYKAPRWLPSHLTQRIFQRRTALVLALFLGTVLLTHIAATQASSLTALQAPANTTPYGLSTASFLGGSSDTDRVRGARIQSDGTLVLVANISNATPGNVTPTLLNGATATSGGAVIRMSGDGRTVLSVARVAEQVEDIALDAANNIYVAAWNNGMLKLNPAATEVVWAKTPGRVLRVDAGTSGHSVALVTTSTNPDASNPGSGTVVVYGPDGAQISSNPGKHNTLDVCLDSASQTVVTIGWRQATAFDGNKNQPVQIAYLRGAGFSGNEKYNAYDWSTDRNSDRFINKPTNNMADTRGYRCTIGGDGKLYAAFEAAGGNHIFRYSPFNISQQLPSGAIVGGDQWHSFHNTRSEHKTFFARYEPGTGQYLLGQQFLTRKESDGGGNAAFVNKGAITADAQGRVYIGGSSAWGLPMPPHKAYKAKDGETVFNPLDPEAYLGGSWFLVMSPDFKSRLYMTRLSESGSTHAIDARTLENGTTSIVFAGQTKSDAKTHTANAIQARSWGGSHDGWFGVLGGEGGTPTPPTPTPAQLVARMTVAPAWGAAPLEVSFDASTSTAPEDDAISSYTWTFGDGQQGSGVNPTHTYAEEGAHEVTLTITTASGETATATTTLVVGGSQIYLPMNTRQP